LIFTLSSFKIDWNEQGKLGRKMDMKVEIRKLARIEEGPHPFFSLYLNTRWNSEQQRERIRLFTKNQLKRGSDQIKGRETWQKFYPEDQKQIERFVEALVRHTFDQEVHGMAIFSCKATNTFLTYPSIIPFENEFFLSGIPVLRPIVQLSSQYQDTLAVMVETDSAKLFEISLEGLTAESSIESYVPGRHDQGGWAQMRYQRHIRDHMNKHHKEVSEQLTDLFDTGRWRRIVLIGQDRTIANFKTFLPERVRLQITDTLSVDFSEERSRVLRRIFERLFQREKEEVSRQIEELKERTPLGGRATFGLTGTLKALNKGQIQTLYILASFARTGRLCSRCDSLGHIHPPDHPSAFCPFCQGNTREVDLGEEMGRAVLRQDGEVKWIEKNIILGENDGVGASLRFASSRSSSVKGA
jgi:peptide chain release factor subunit 1